MGVLEGFRERYLRGDGEAVTNDLHQLSIDELIAALREIEITHQRSHGRPNALKKAAAYIVNGRKF